MEIFRVPQALTIDVAFLNISRPSVGPQMMSDWHKIENVLSLDKVNGQEQLFFSLKVHSQSGSHQTYHELSSGFCLKAGQIQILVRTCLSLLRCDTIRSPLFGIYWQVVTPL